MIKIQASEFKEAVAALQPAIGTNKLIDIYDYVIMEDAGDSKSVRLRAKSDGMHIQVVVPAARRGNSDLPIALHGKKLTSILKNLNDDDAVEIKADKVIAINAGGVRYRLLRRECETFPDAIEKKGKDKIKVKAEAFADAIRKVSGYAISTNGRYIFSAVRLAVADKKLELTAINPHRGATINIDILKKAGNIKRPMLVLPAGLLAIIASAPDDCDIVIMSSGGCLTASFDKTDLAITELEGSFCDMRQLIPKNTGTLNRVKLCASACIKAINQTALVVTKDSHAITAAIDNDVITFSAQASTIGEAEAEIDCQSKNEFSFSVVPEYLIEAMAQTENPILYYGDPENNRTPLYIVEDNYEVIISPVKIRDVEPKDDVDTESEE